jgi:hypothetical protein
MSWRGWLAAMALPVCGCFTKASTLADLPPLPASPVAAGPAVTRAQKPDTANSSANTAVCRLINLPVDRPAEVSHASPTATIRAVVNGDLILDQEVRMACLHELGAARTPKDVDEIFKQALEAIIEREIVLQDAISKLKRGGKQGEALLKKFQEIASEEFDKRWLRPMLKVKHLANREELAALMRESGLSLEMMRRSWERNFLYNEYLRSRIETHISRIGHTEITEYYNSHRDEYTQPDTVDWQDIFIDASRHASRAAASQFAGSLVQRIRQGEDFIKLSAEFDDGESGRFRKGAGQGHKRGEIFPHEAEELLFQMHDSDIDIVERPRGFHVVRLIKRQYAGPIPFDAKVQKEIHDKLRTIVFMREKDSIVKELKRKAVIDRYDGP